MDDTQRNVSNKTLDSYLTGRIDRREFLRRMALIGGGVKLLASNPQSSATRSK